MTLIYLCGHVHLTAYTWSSKDNWGSCFLLLTWGSWGLLHSDWQVPLPPAAPPVHLSEGFTLCACVNVGCVLTRGWLSGDNSGAPVFFYNLMGAQLRLDHLQSTLPAEPFHQQKTIRIYYRVKWVPSKYEDRWWLKGRTAMEETLS